MRKLINTIFCCICFLGMHAQGINFESADWKSVLEKARKENKMIYMDIYAEWCGPCKMMAKNIFPTTEAGEKYNSAFVNYKVDAEKGEGIELAKKFKVTAYPTNLYIDPKNEGVVYKAIGATDLNGFLQRADFALAEFNDPMTLEVYEKGFKKGERKQSFLEKYIEKANRSDQYPDEALNEYLKLYSQTNKDSVISFLLENTQTFDNNAVAFLMANKEEINTKHKNQSSDFLKDWMQKLPYHTFQKAIKTKNEKLIDLLYGNLEKYQFDQNILGKGGLQIMYYQQLGDEEKTKLRTTQLLDELTTLPKASYESQNKLELEGIKKAIAQQVKQAGMPEEKVGEILKGTLEEHPEYALSGNFLAAQKLNEGAWQVYEQKETDKKIMKKALSWAKKAMDLSQTLPQWSIYADTYAHLLYRKGEKQKAIEMQEKAVQRAQKDGVESLAELQKSLDLMKSESF